MRPALALGAIYYTRRRRRRRRVHTRRIASKLRALGAAGDTAPSSPPSLPPRTRARRDRAKADEWNRRDSHRLDRSGTVLPGHVSQGEGREGRG